MRKELLNQRPTSALRGQSPLCESVGTGHTSTHPSIFTKVLLVLLTMLLLPSATWGQWDAKTFIFNGCTDDILYAVDSNDETQNYSWYFQSSNGSYCAGLVESKVKISVGDNYGKGVLTPPNDYTIKKVTLNYSNLQVTEGSKIYVRAVNWPDTTSHYTDPYLMTSDGTLDINLNDEGISSENLRFLIFSNDDKAYSYILNSITITKIADYNISIGGVPLTGANVNPATGAVTGLTGVYFTPANNTVSPATPATLTLNGATINGQITSDIGALKVHLVGENTITSGTGNVPFKYTGSDSGSLTFESTEDEKGAITISGGQTYYQQNGSQLQSRTGFTDAMYTISNSIDDLGTTGDWQIIYDTPNNDDIQIYRNVLYNLWVGDYQVSKANKTSISSGYPNFDDEDNSLIIDGGYNLTVKSGMSNLKVKITQKDCSLERIYFESVDGGPSSGTLTFVKDADTDLASITLTATGTNKAIEGFAVDDIIITTPLELKTPTLKSDILDATTVRIANYSQAYDITVAGVQVTDANAGNVLNVLNGNGTPTVVFTPADNTVSPATPATLTLNDATIIPESEEYGITYTGTTDLVISLNGTNNVVKGGGGCTAIGCDNDASPTLKFINGGTDTCSLLLETVGTPTIDFEDVNHTGLYKIDETILGADKDNIYRTTFTSTILSGGSGTNADPFIIGTADDLRNFARYINNRTIGSDVSVKLSDEISEKVLDCSSLTDFEPIGDGNDLVFTGTFDGNNKTIKNLSISGDNGAYVGIVRSITTNGKIENLTLDNLTISGGAKSSNYIGGLVGYMEGGTISNCTIQNSSISCLTTTSNPSVGGFVGFLGGGTISNSNIVSCIVKAENSNTADSSPCAIGGGIAGTIMSGTVRGCRVKGTTAVSANYGEEVESIYAGALVGNKNGGNFTDNAYEYTVTAKERTTTISGYTQRGVGGKYYDEDLETYVDNPDIIENNGAVLYTKPVVLPGESSAGAVTGEEGTYYIEDDESILVAPGQMAKINAMPSSEEPYTLLWLKAVDASTEGVIATDSTNIADGGRQYTFTMPDAQVNVTTKFAIDISSNFYKQVDTETTYNGTAQALSAVSLSYGEGQVQESLDLTIDDDDEDFTVTKYEDSKGTDLGTTAPTDANTYTVTIEGKGDYTGTRDITYKINPRDLETAAIADIEDQIFTGTAIEPEPQVSILLKEEDDEATVLVKDQDFTYNYEANTNISSEATPKVIVTGTGNYTGTAEKTFNIVESYNVWVAGTLITSANAGNVLGGSPAMVTYDSETNTLTLNKAYIVTSNSAGIKSGLSNLNVVLSGGQSEVKCTGEDYYAFEGTAENATVTFSALAASVGYLDITTAGYNKFFKDITPAYDGITHFDQTSVYTNEYYYHIRKSPWTGSGTADAPYLISTTTDLKTMSTYAYQGIVLNHYFKLNNDIVWSQETGAFTSIGRRYDNYRIYSFDGTFDGNYKTISNLTSSNGLFNYVMNEGSIKNLTLTNCTVTGGDTGESAGGLVADFRSSGMIQNCSVKSSTISNNNYANITSAGGIVGYQAGGTIENCNIEDVTVTMSGSSTYTQSAGGIVGHTYNRATVNGCRVIANSTGNTKITNTSETDKTLNAGAIVGWREQETTLTSNTYQAGVVVETQKGNDANAKVTKSGNKQRGLGDGDDVVNGAELEGVKKITVTKNDKGTVEYMSNIYREDGSDIYVLPYSLSGELTIIKGTSGAGYDEPTIAIKTVTNSTPIIPEAAEDTSDEGLFYTEWSFQMPNDDATASIMFAINLAKEARNFVIAGRDYTGDPLPVTEIKTTLDDLDGANPAFIELQSGTHFNVTGYKKSDDTDLGTTAPTNAGNYKIVIEGTGDCVGTVTLPFVINRLAITPEITVTGWIYGSYDVTGNGPTLTEGSNPENGEVTYYFKKDTDEEFHKMELSSTTDAGTYLVIATVAETDNYKGGSSEEVKFVIDQYDLGNATVTLDPEELVYDGKEHTINVTVMADDMVVDPSYYVVNGNKGKEAKTYTVSVTATEIEGGNNFKNTATATFTIKNRTVTANELGLSENQPQATYYSDTENLEVPDGVVANIITSVSDGKATTQRISYIPKNVPVFVELTTSSEEPIEIPEDPSELPLKGTAEPKDVTSISGGTVFVLYKGEFVKSISGTIPAHRCYLLLPNDVAAGTRAFGIIRGVGGSNGSTAIKSIEIDNTPSTIENWYDMRGRRIEKPTKTGIYIKNGKIVVINNK